MSALVSPIQHFETVAEQFINEFSLDQPGYKTERKAHVDGVNLSLGMISISMAFRTLEEQQKFFEEADRETLETSGNPSAVIRTYDRHESSMAFYVYDRNTDLILVNNYNFPEGETRQLRKKDVDALGFSLATGGIAGGGTRRVLTELGIVRLASDIEAVIDEA
jgi:hypothetical protein